MRPSKWLDAPAGASWFGRKRRPANEQMSTVAQVPEPTRKCPDFSSKQCSYTVIFRPKPTEGGRHAVFRKITKRVIVRNLGNHLTEKACLP